MATRLRVLAALVATLSTPGGVVAQTGTASFAAAGATVGVVGLGSFFGLIAAGLCDKAVCDGEFTHGFMVGATVGAAGGALLGAGVGSLVRRPEAAEADGTDRATELANWTWHVHYGRPSASGPSPPPGSAFRAGLGYRVKPGVVLGTEVMRVGFVETQRVDDPTVPISSYSDEDARATSILVSWAYSMDPGDHLRLVLAAGGVRTVHFGTVTEQWPAHRTEPFERSSLGLHTGGTIEAGWRVAGRVRMGFEARLDWISHTPMGALSFYTLSLALWG